MAKELNAVVDLTIIDRTLAGVAAELRRGKAEADVCRGRLREASARQRELAWAERADRDLRRVERAEKVYKDIASRRESLASILREGEELRRKGDRLSSAILASQRAVRAGERLEAVRGRTEGLRKLLDSLSCLDSQASKTRESRLEAEAGLKRFRSCPVCGQVFPKK